MRVHWDRLGPATIEQMVAVLLSRENPTLQRVDGRGGDGGRDAQFRSADGLHFYEIKSFCDRVDDRRGRRRQVERSLEAAARQRPASWTLTVPVDPTQAELAWFERLQQAHAFPLRWWGLTQLDGLLAAYPDVAAYYVQDQRDEVLRLLQEHSALHAAAPNVDTVLARLHAVKDRLDGLDPHLTFEIITRPVEEAVLLRPDAVMFTTRTTALGPVTLAVVSKYAGAARDSQVPKLRLSLRFRDDEAGTRARDLGSVSTNGDSPGGSTLRTPKSSPAPRPADSPPSPDRRPWSSGLVPPPAAPSMAGWSAVERAAASRPCQL